MNSLVLGWKHRYSMGIKEIAVPATNTKYSGNTSPRTPYSTADKALPPTQADWMKPMIAPRFSSGSASINDALKTVFPAQFMNAPRNAKMHMITKFPDKNPRIINTPEAEKPTAMTPNRAFALNGMIPSSTTQAREAAVQTVIR